MYFVGVMLVCEDYVCVKKVLEEFVQVYEDLNFIISFGVFYLRVLMVEVCVYFGDVESGRKILEECFEEWKVNNLYFEYYWVVCVCVFFEGLRL